MIVWKRGAWRSVPIKHRCPTCRRVSAAELWGGRGCPHCRRTPWRTVAFSIARAWHELRLSRERIVEVNAAARSGFGGLADALPTFRDIERALPFQPRGRV